MSRRRIGWLTLAATLTLAAGCGGKADAPSGGPPAPQVQIALTVDEQPAPVGESVLLGIIGFEEDHLEFGLPKKGITPTFSWRAELPGEWPLKVDVSVPMGLHLLAIRDANGDGITGIDDRLCDPFVVKKGTAPGAAVAVRLDQVFSPGPGQGLRGHEPGKGPGYPEDQSVEVVLHVDRSPELADLEPASVMVHSFRPGDLVDGLPQAGVVPLSFWAMEDPDGDWPLEVRGWLPLGQDVLVVVDGDGNRGPGPGDWVTAAVPGFALPEGGRPVELTVIGPFSGVAPPAEEEPADPEAGDDESAGDPPPIDPAVQVEGKAAKLELDSRPRVPFLSEGQVMIAGYRSSDVEADMPRRGASPVYFWRSEVLKLEWPVKLDAPLPTDVTVFLLLDLDEDDLPSVGDLSSVPHPEFSLPPEGTPATFVFEQAFGFTDAQPE
jgi:hypothetical protein